MRKGGPSPFSIPPATQRNRALAVCASSLGMFSKYDVAGQMKIVLSIIGILAVVVVIAVIAAELVPTILTEKARQKAGVSTQIVLERCSSHDESGLDGGDAQDGWGNPLHVERVRDHTIVVSAGKDGQIERELSSYADSRECGPTHDWDDDIVCRDGVLLTWPTLYGPLRDLTFDSVQRCYEMENEVSEGVEQN